MEALVIVLVIVVILLVIAAGMSVRVVKQYEQGVLFRLGKVLGARTPGLRITELPGERNFSISYTGKRRVLSRYLLRTLAGCPAKFAVARQGPDFFV